jgi:hypothetical protein
MRELVLIVALGTSACGKDVDLGGTPDGSVAEAGAVECMPCSAGSDCASSEACAQYGGDTFCAPLCPAGNECGATTSCRDVPVADSGAARACIPLAGACLPPAGPAVDGGPLQTCGALDGPTVVAQCHSCGRYSDDCQKNGCYGGWWCNTTTTRCVSPPKSCP